MLERRKVAKQILKNDENKAFVINSKKTFIYTVVKIIFHRIPRTGGESS